jgi:hypothetical protein
MKNRIQKISKHAPSIFQGKLDFAAAGRGASLSVEHPLERVAMSALALALVALIGGYLYFVSASVLNVMARREAIAQVAQIEGTIGGLEQQYFALSESVSPQLGAALGLSPARNTQYVYRPGTIGAVTMARNEI